MAQATITRPQRYEYRGQRDGIYYWARPLPGTVYEELVTCSKTWFWGER